VPVLAVVDTVEIDVVVAVADVSVLVKTPGQMYWKRLLGTAAAPVMVE